MDDAIKKGAKTLTGGKRPEMQGDLAKGNFYEPTILGDATIDMKVCSALCKRVCKCLGILGCQQPSWAPPQLAVLCNTGSSAGSSVCGVSKPLWCIRKAVTKFSNALQIFSEETFGPAVPLFKVNSFLFRKRQPCHVACSPVGQGTARPCRRHWTVHWYLCCFLLPQFDTEDEAVQAGQQHRVRPRRILLHHGEFGRAIVSVNTCGNLLKPRSSPALHTASPSAAALRTGL